MDVAIWSGVFAGVAIGLYSTVQLWVSGYALGVSTAYGNFCAFVSKSKFFSSGEFVDPWNWRLFFILGIVPGGALAALTTPGFEYSLSMSMGEHYDEALPDSPMLKSLVLFFGGALLGLGARMANGCTSGHAIAGVSMLNVNSIVLAVLFFVSATVTGQILLS